MGGGGGYKSSTSRCIPMRPPLLLPLPECRVLRPRGLAPSFPRRSCGRAGEVRAAVADAGMRRRVDCGRERGCCVLARGGKEQRESQGVWAERRCERRDGCPGDGGGSGPFVVLLVGQRPDPRLLCLPVPSLSPELLDDMVGEGGRGKRMRRDLARDGWAPCARLVMANCGHSHAAAPLHMPRDFKRRGAPAATSQIDPRCTAKEQAVRAHAEAARPGQGHAEVIRPHRRAASTKGAWEAAIPPPEGRRC